jgi:hypothetical protein
MTLLNETLMGRASETREGTRLRLTTTRLLFAHWDLLRGERAAPTRADIDPARLRGFLADVFMLDAHPWQDGRIRLAGTRICALFGHELKGRHLPDLWLDEERAEVSRLVGAVTGGMHGLVASVTGETARGRELDAELLLLPVRPSPGGQCGAIGSFTAVALPTWLGVDHIAALTTKTLRMIERTPRGQPPFGRLIAPSAAAGTKREHLIVLPGGRD